MMQRWEELELVGQTLREIGVLIAVFIPVDALFQSPRPGAGLIFIGVVVGLILVTGGIIVEARGRRRLKWIS